MREKRLFQRMELAADEFVLEAERGLPAGAGKKVKKSGWCVLASAAATICLVIGALALVRGGLRLGGGDHTSDDGAVNGAGHGEESSEFMSYAGPVLPLTLSEESEISATRDIAFVFPGESGEQLKVRDTYVVFNESREDITVTGYYPYAGNFWELRQVRPEVTVNGQAVETTIRTGEVGARTLDEGDEAGAQATGEVDAQVSGGDGGALDWKLEKWQDYQALLAGGHYLDAALTEAAGLDQPVAVYEFSDFQAPLGEYPAASQAVSFWKGQGERQVFTYGFNGYEWREEEGMCRYSYFVPGSYGADERKLLIVMGEDLENYTLTGYEDGGCEEGEELETVSCTVTRRESTLGEVISEVLPGYVLPNWEAFGEKPDGASADAVAGLAEEVVKRDMSRYGDFLKLRPEDISMGELETLFSRAFSWKRVFYEEFSMTIPAGGSAVVQAVMCKWPSFDYSCGQSEDVGVRGYDMLTAAGSRLAITETRASLEQEDGIELVRQNFGFDLEAGVSSVILDPAKEHYYLEVRRKGE